MEPGQSLARSTRLTQIQYFLHKNPRGLTTKELAKLSGVCIRTIQRDLRALENDLEVPLTQTGDRYGILEGYILPPVSFSLYEAMAVFLTSRLALRQMDERNPHVESALTRMAGVLPPVLGQRVKESIQAIMQKPRSPEQIRIFEHVAIGWSTQRRMRILYRSLQSAESREWMLEPYFVDMTGVGYSTYVIGNARRGGKDRITTFKLDRIEQAELLEENFEVPDGLSLDSLLGLAWGIMWGEGTEVKLKFSPQVTRRVKESLWHPSQVIEDLPDGGCILTVRVGSVLEMTPWVRSWGSDVEVLAPQKLREQMVETAQSLLKTYKASQFTGSGN